MTTLNPRDTYLAASVSTATPRAAARHAVRAASSSTSSVRPTPCVEATQPGPRAAAARAGDRPRAQRQPGRHVLGRRPGLASLYDYLHAELVKANMAKDLKTAEFCLDLVTVLRDAWRDAAGSLLGAVGVIDRRTDDRHHLHWATALDRLELEVIRAERLLADPTPSGPDPWDEPAPPRVRSPPTSVDRALDLREPPGAACGPRSTALARTIGRQHDFADRVDRATRAHAPARSTSTSTA